jgi:hypothetical protein
MPDSETLHADETCFADRRRDEPAFDESGSGSADRSSLPAGQGATRHGDEGEAGRSMEDGAPTCGPEKPERMPGLPQAHRGPF